MWHFVFWALHITALIYNLAPMLFVSMAAHYIYAAVRAYSWEPDTPAVSAYLDCPDCHKSLRRGVRECPNCFHEFVQGD